MTIISNLAVLSNILIIIVFICGLFYEFKKPQYKAAFGYLMVGALLFYIILLSLFVILNRYNHLTLILVLCALMPFIIGRLVDYNSLKKYTIIQILSCLVSLIILLTLL